MNPHATVTRLPRVAALSWSDCVLLVESVTDYAIFMLDTDGRVATWNSGAEKIKGYRADEIIGKHFSTFFTREDVESGKPERELAMARDSGRHEEEGWRVRKDGTRFWASVVITALRDEGGELRGFAKVTRDLTERRRTEEALQRSEERFRLLVERVGDYAIYMLDPEGVVTTWNLGAERMKGYTAGEIIGKDFAVFFLEEDARSGKPSRELEIARTQGRFEDEGWRVRKDGSRFLANVVVTALRNPRGDLLGFAKITRDLTISRQAEETDRRLSMERAARAAAEEGERRLRESEERYRELSRRLEVILEGVGDGITVQDRSGQVIFANSAAARTCGFGSVDEMLNTPISELVSRFEILDPEGKPFDQSDLPGRRVLRGEPAGNALLHVQHKASGREWWSLVRATPVLSHDGEPELAVSIWHDVTVERRHEEHARYLSEATTALTTSLDYGEMLSTLARVLVPKLSDWCSIYVLDGEQLRNLVVAHADPRKLVWAKEYVNKYPPGPNAPSGIWNVLRTGKSQLYNHIADELIVQNAQSSEHLEVLRAVGMTAVLLVPIRIRDRITGTISLVSAESGRHFDQLDVGLVEELGRRAGVAIENAQLYKAAQVAAKRAEAAAESAEEANRIKDEFLATVSHELRTPLNAIVGWAGILRQRQVEPSIAKGIEVIDRNAQAQTKIIEDILDVSRIITGKLRVDPRPTDLVAITNEAIEVIRPSAAAKEISIEFHRPAEVCLLVGDPQRLQQVVWNLLSNAIKFTDPCGSIRISLRQEASKLILSVSDTGRGMDPEFLPYAFERFKQADASTTRRFGGLGLGLALARHIVELHGGAVVAESAGLGKGSTFTITLPVRAVLPAVVCEQFFSSQDSRAPFHFADVLRDLRVLVVDDDSDARDLLTAVLVGAGAVVQVAGSASEGFDVLRRFRPHVLVSDIGMPDEDGYSFVRRVRMLDPREGGGIPSIALTAYTRNEDRMKALAAGFTTHVGKPVNPDDLVAAVANLAAFARR